MRTQSRRAVGVALALAGVLALTPTRAAAHHGWSGNFDQEFQLTGTLETDVSLGGPHGTMRVRAADGQVWDITLAPGPRTDRAGLRPGMIPRGAQVTISGHRNRDPKRFEIKTERVAWNGKTFDVYPDRH
jgi:Family of unknown function (DUF6152)